MFTIRGAEIVDGTGSPSFSASVVVDGDRIVEIGTNIATRGTVVNADGLTLVHGFIDMHSHSDVPLWIDGRAISKISQGITTEVVGNCGMSAAPLYGPMLNEVGEAFRRFGRELPFTTMSAYLRGLSEQSAVNVVALIGHGTLRRGIVGEADRLATDTELDAMAAAIDTAMQQGAFGVSTGLIYPPGCYANTDEIITLARSLVPYQGIYFTHMRSESYQLIEAVQEALTIGLAAGVSVQISHHKAMGPLNWGKTVDTLAMIDSAIAQGQDVWLDQYPYEASATQLSALLPKWVLAGGRDEALERMSNPSLRTQISHETDVDEQRFGWDRTRVGTVSDDRWRWAEGQSIVSVAARLNVEPVDAFMQLLQENQLRVSMIRFGIGEDDMKRVILHPRTLIGTDGAATAPDGPYGKQNPHPRTYGTFARVLRWYVRELGWLSFEQAISRMTGLAARRLGLGDRGLIRIGAAADLVLLDRERIADMATFAVPNQLSEGIVSVWVNGTRVFDNRTWTGSFPGTPLCRSV